MRAAGYQVQRSNERLVAITEEWSSANAGNERATRRPTFLRNNKQSNFSQMNADGQYQRLEAICIGADCTRPVRARGMCATHWARWRKHGDHNSGARTINRSCQVAGCVRPHYCKDFCRLHYVRWKRNGHLRNNNEPELVGHVFGRIVVISFRGSHEGQRYWNCKCACGTERSYATGYLTSNRVKSCGCLMVETNTKYPAGSTHRRCTKCGADRPLECFFSRKGGQVGVTSRCRFCASREAKRHASEMTDHYVAVLMGFAPSQAPSELVQLKREHLRLVRLLREKTNGQTRPQEH